MIFEIVFINSYLRLYTYIVLAIHPNINTPPTETYFNCPEFDITDPWDSLTEVEYIEDILENSSEDSDFSDYERRPFDIFGNKTHDYIGQYYQAAG